jgi:2-polyprenyl-3-methyl-5-hydroxy-6-metoxy-1,4-benzoquinol methylase
MSISQTNASGAAERSAVLNLSAGYGLKYATAATTAIRNNDLPFFEIHLSKAAFVMPRPIDPSPEPKLSAATTPPKSKERPRPKRLSVSTVHHAQKTNRYSCMGTCMSENAYVLGHSQSEIQRLIFQARVIRPITERLLREAGLTAGMRVIDIGCGAGDVSMIAAEMVGPSGSIVAIDRDAGVLEIARARAKAAGFTNIEFRQVTNDGATERSVFDIAVGRYVLLHQPDPSVLIQQAASYVRQRGVVAFHEVLTTGRRSASRPPVPLWDQNIELLMAAMESSFPNPDAGARMIEHFHNAGLPQPSLFCELAVGGGPDSPFYEWMTASLESMAPQWEKSGAARREDVGLDTLAARLREAVAATHSQLETPPQFCGWVRV